MFQFSASELTRLARLYCEARSVAPSMLGKAACNNNKVFVRLLANDRARCRSDTAERASQWFLEHWPRGLFWPSDIPRPKLTTRMPQSRPAAGAVGDP
jgi:hypothetical protein